MTIDAAIDAFLYIMGLAWSFVILYLAIRISKDNKRGDF